MRSLLGLVLGVAVAASTTRPLSGQGIALPVSPRTTTRVVEEVTVREIRADTIPVELQQSELSTLESVVDRPVRITRNGQEYEVIRDEVQGRQARATRPIVVERSALVLSAPEPCELEGAGLLRGFPVRTRTQAECFWNQAGIETLNHASLSGTGESRSVTVDLVSDLIGPVRAYVVGSVAAANPVEESDAPSTQAEGEETEAEVDANVQKFLTSGGNAVLGLVFPGPTFRTATSNAFSAPDFMAYLLLAPRVGFDVPQANSSSDNPRINLDLGPELTMAAHGNQLALFSQVRLAMVAGSPEFYRGLSMEKNTPFGYGRVNVGLRLRVLGYTNVLLSWSKPFTGPDQLLKSGSQLHFTVQKEDEQLERR